MTKRYLCGLGAVALSFNVLAQSIIGSVSDVKGLVTVSDAATIATAVIGAPITEGMRFVTSSSGSITLKMNNGCDIHLRPNQSLIVEDKRDCDILFGLIRSVPGASLAGVGAGNNTVLQVLGIAAITALIGGGGTPGSGGNPGGNTGGGATVPLPPPDISSP